MVPGNGRKRLEKGLRDVYWGLGERRLRFLDVYTIDKRKPL